MTTADRTVAVTGASGLVGGRIVERLVLDGAERVVPVVRGFGRVARFALLPQDRMSFRVADLLDQGALEDAFRGVDAVVHCAFGSRGSEDERWATTVGGTANVLAAARRAGVRRVVHLSTLDVYDRSTIERITESAPARPDDPGDREYEQQKLAAERLVLRAHGDGLETVVLQPGVIYGPWAEQWTVAQLTRPAADYEHLPTGDAGISNAVHVDDVADAARLAVAAPGAAGQRYLVGSDEPVSWGAFFDAFRGMLGHGTPSGAGRCTVADWELALYRQPGRAEFGKLRRELGHHAQVSFADGIALTAQWARWYGLVPASAS